KANAAKANRIIKKKLKQIINDGKFITSLQVHPVTVALKLHKRYQIITLSSYGINKRVISRFTDCNMEMIYRWSRRCDFNDNARPGRPLLYNEETHLKTIAFYCQTTPLPDCGRWTLRWAEKRLKEDLNPIGQPISRATIQRILKNHTLKPHLSKYFLQITDPDFFPKMQHIISLYMNKPEYLFCFDECPGIQVLQRLAPHLQTETMQKRLEEFEYIRNGTIDVFAFLRVKSGKIFAECRADHT
ncbi:MAG: helix-turn-helix domain-containing protein, partial [Gammaproteobacteria bacterium]|nr:helix-turn-helix domain-containing protein [Gammaproteobacteria bacterium]